MAEAERRSKPRKPEPKDDDDVPEPKGHGLLLLALLVGCVAILEGMFVVAGFLSNSGGKDLTLLIAFGVTLAVAAALYLWGRAMQKRTA